MLLALLRTLTLLAMLLHMPPGSLMQATPPFFLPASLMGSAGKGLPHASLAIPPSSPITSTITAPYILPLEACQQVLDAQGTGPRSERKAIPK
mmetsp:Transcript_2947/g.6293  ORF Transcript_2947/g.6293 Transcript_2947/m.6293 type:complete len:93 (-) Transcript_2947:247-525(-)